ncbi:MAG: efflux RND transporter permease subunit, partial [Muribaculum sp.]|nr:efflux RND transporter permease subunit [Muribaculum sp.]
MVKFLLQRPIAVIMAFLAIVIVGCVTYFTLPVSLLPSIDIPRIMVRVESDNASAREIENTVTATLRRQLQQVGGLNEIKSSSHDGYATIALSFEYGTDTDLAFIEVNEKIDAAMGYLPREVQRPRVVKASATDIPVVYLQLTLKDGYSEDRFVELAEIADNTVRRSIEQMPEVAMVDVSGIPARYIRVVPDLKKTHSIGLTADDIENSIKANNYTPGAMTVRDGYYEYSISVSNQLRDINDIKNIFIRHNGRLFRLGDIADIDIATLNEHGESIYNGNRAITMAVIKHDNENIDRMKTALATTIGWLSAQYPEISIKESRNQTELLDYTISNLLQNLVLGMILVFFITAIFMHDMRTPFIIGLSIIVALILTM